MTIEEKIATGKEIRITDNGVCNSVYNPATKIVHSTYLTYHKSEEARHYFYGHIENIVRFAGQQPVNGILADLREFSGQFLHALKYLDTEVMPVMKANGLVAEAFVSSQDPRVRQLCLNLAAQQNRHGVKAKIFYTLDEAHAWLLQAVGSDDH